MDEESVLRIRNFNPFINSCCVLRRYVVRSNFILFCSFFWLINVRTDACICHRKTWPRPLLVAVWAENYFVLESGKNIDTLDQWTYARTYVRRKVEVSKVFKILISFVRSNGFLWEIKFTKKIVLTYVRRNGKMTSANNSVQFRAKLSCVRTYAEMISARVKLRAYVRTYTSFKRNNNNKKKTTSSHPQHEMMLPVSFS